MTKQGVEIPDWETISPDLRARVISELDACKWEAANSDRQLALAFAAAAAALHQLAAG